MQHFYDAQIRRYILQFIRMMSNFTYVTGKNSKGVSETKGTSTNATNAMSVDLATGNFFEIDLQNNNANLTSFTFSNPAASGKASSWVIKWIQGSSARTLTYPAAVKWSNGADHIMSTANDAVDIVSFFTIDAGTTVYASIVGQAFAA